MFSDHYFQSEWQKYMGQTLYFAIKNTAYRDYIPIYSKKNLRKMFDLTRFILELNWRK